MNNSIGMVGSPSTTGKATVDVLEEATNLALHGQLVYLAHKLGDKFLVALGTVMEIRTSNRWHEDPNMRGVLKIHGSLPHLSAVGDVRTAEVGIQAAYLAESLNFASGEPAIESGGALSMSPTTGAEVSLVTDDFLTKLLRRHRDAITYLGTIYKTDVRLPLTIRDFRSVEQGGAGEAYHTGIFGMTGSGKSALATYLIGAQLQHRALGVIIMDPQGQFTGEEGLPFSLQDWASSLDRPVWKLSLSSDLRLPKDAFLLGDLLGLTRFFRDLLSIKHEASRESAAAEFTRLLQNTSDWEKREAEDVLRAILSDLINDTPALTRIYATPQSRAKLTSMMQNILDDPGSMQIALSEFAPLHNLFAPTNAAGGTRRALYPLLQEAINPEREPRPLVVIDYSATGEQGELLNSAQVKARIIRLVCSRLNRVAEDAYREGESLNVLVVFDEAQRFAAQEPEDEQVHVLADKLVDYVRTTRKYGLGWTFITQETTALRHGIYRQLRVRAFGYGLTSGTELSRLRDTIGNDAAVDLYRTFVDPGAITPRQYPFMLQGPISPLSFTGAPLFLSVYTRFEDFKKANDIL